MLNTNVVKKSYNFCILQDGETRTKIITVEAESWAAARLLLPENCIILEEKENEQ